MLPPFWNVMLKIIVSSEDNIVLLKGCAECRGSLLATLLYMLVFPDIRLIRNASCQNSSTPACPLYAPVNAR